MGKISGINDNSGMVTVNAGKMFGQNNILAGDNNKDKKTVFGGGLNPNHDSIFAKKERAKKEALKILTNVMESDLKTDEQQARRLKNISDMERENEAGKLGLLDLDAREKDLMEEYGITYDSEEYKDLELIRRATNKKDPLARFNFNEDEKSRYEAIKEKGYTDFQTRALEIDVERDSIKQDMQDNAMDIKKEEAEYEFTEESLLRNTPMTEARAQAEAILEAASQDVIAALYNEAKENIDKKAEEEQEKQKKVSEEKKAQEKEDAERELKELERELMLQEAKDKGKAKLAQQEARAKSSEQVSLDGVLSEDMYSAIGADNYGNVVAEQQISKLLDKMNLLKEDIKGITVDDTV